MGKKLYITLIIIILTLVGFIYHLNGKIRELEVESVINDQNTIALKDSIQTTKNKLGEVEYSKSLLILERDELKHYNVGLSNELEKEKGNVSELTSMVINLEGKITELESGITYIPPVNETGDTLYRIDWNLKKNYDEYNWRKIGGYTTFNMRNSKLINTRTFLTQDDIQFNLIQGLRERDGVVEIFARSNYEGFGVKEINSVVIDPNTHPVLTKFTKSKEKRFGLAFYSGYGITFNSVEPTVVHGFQVGGGIYWKLKLF